MYITPSSYQSKLSKDKVYFDYEFDKNNDNNRFIYLDKNYPNYND